MLIVNFIPNPSLFSKISLNLSALHSLWLVNVDAKGKEIDQGALLRYLGEIVWVPSAALSDYITREEMDSITARATMSYGGITASGIFKFDENGAFVSFEADRYYYRKEGSTLEKWVITAKNYKEFEGIRVPVTLSRSKFA